MGHENPNLWFSDVPTKEGPGKPTRSDLKIMFDNSLEALRICNACPVSDECLEIGMLPDNVDHGIWGGKLSGERLQLSGVNMTTNDRLNKVLFAKHIRNRQTV